MVAEGLQAGDEALGDAFGTLPGVSPPRRSSP